MEHGLTKKQKDFADGYMETGNGTRAALDAYDTDDYQTAASIASENLKKPEIMAYFRDKAATVAANIYNLALSAESEQVQLRAGQDILDRAGYKPTDKVDHTSDGKALNVVFDSSFAKRYQEDADAS